MNQHFKVVCEVKIKLITLLFHNCLVMVKMANTKSSKILIEFNILLRTCQVSESKSVQ